MDLSDIDTSSRKHAAIAFLRLVVAGKIAEAYATYVAPGMRHHNMAFAGDAASLRQAMEENHVQYPHKMLDVQRALEDGELVAVHSRVRLTPEDTGFATVHLFRFAGDRIVEEWEFGQAAPAESPNENGLF